MEPISLTACKVVRLPPIQHELESLSYTLCWFSQPLTLFNITVQEAPEVWKQVHAVWETGGIWSIILENCPTSHKLNVDILISIKSYVYI